MKDTDPILHLKKRGMNFFYILTEDFRGFFFLNTWTIWKVFTEMWGHMETLLLARLPTHTRMRIIYEESICSHTYTLITPCDFTSCTPTHVNIVSASGCACTAALSLAKLARNTLLHSPAPKNIHFAYSHAHKRTDRHTFRQVERGCEWVEPSERQG